MKEINLDDLELVIGGARRGVVAASRRGNDQELQLALLKMQSDLERARENPQNNQMAMMTFAIAAMAMNRNRGFA